MNEEGCILTGATGSAFILRCEGRLTQKSMWNMNAATARYRAAGATGDVLVDVTLCSYMDSTMLGLLARLALVCRATHGARPFLVGLGEGELARVFKRMSLDRLFELSARPVPVLDLQPPAAPPRPSHERARQVLLAHETLAELSPANAQAFALLLDMLRKGREESTATEGRKRTKKDSCPADPAGHGV